MEFVSTRLTSTELPFTVLYGVALLGTLYGAGSSPFPWHCVPPARLPIRALSRRQHNHASQTNKLTLRWAGPRLFL